MSLREKTWDVNTRTPSGQLIGLLNLRFNFTECSTAFIKIESYLQKNYFNMIKIVILSFIKKNFPQK